jgi:hypothetical protein
MRPCEKSLRPHTLRAGAAAGGVIIPDRNPGSTRLSAITLPHNHSLGSRQLSVRKGVAGRPLPSKRLTRGLSAQP